MIAIRYLYKLESIKALQHTISYDSAKHFLLLIRLPMDSSYCQGCRRKVYSIYIYGQSLVSLVSNYMAVRLF